MAFSMRNLVKWIMPGFGTGGNDGGSSVYVTGTAATVSSAAATATATSAGTCNQGYVQFHLYGGASSAVLTGWFVTVTDGTTTEYIEAVTCDTFTTVTNQGLRRVIPFMSDLAVNKASVTFITSAGTYNVDIELAGNTGLPASGTGQL